MGRFIIGLLLVGMMALPALAQQTPPPPRSVTGVSTTTSQIGQVLFDAAEKAVIEKFFGRSATTMDTRSVVKDTIQRVINTSTGASTTSRRAGKDDDDDDYKDRRGKKRKHWKKDKHKKNSKKHRKKNGKGLPPGLAKRKSLPPGLQRQLERNGRLPPGLQKRDLPGNLRVKMPPPKQGTERLIAGKDVVLIHQATGIVLDILRAVVTR